MEMKRKSISKKSAVGSRQSAVPPPLSSVSLPLTSVLRPLTSRRQAAGFTLLELLIVIALIMLLAGLMIPAFYKIKNAAKDKQQTIESRIIGEAIRAYKLQAKKFPAPPDDLGGGSERTYGDGDRDNRLVMDWLRDAIPPVLDVNKLRWDDEGNVLKPDGDQYRITLDLDYDGRIGGDYVEYKVE